MLSKCYVWKLLTNSWEVFVNLRLEVWSRWIIGFKVRLLNPQSWKQTYVESFSCFQIELQHSTFNFHFRYLKLIFIAALCNRGYDSIRSGTVIITWLNVVEWGQAGLSVGLRISVFNAIYIADHKIWDHTTFTDPRSHFQEF